MISVLIPTYNRPELLDRVLYRYYAQNYHGEYEILVMIDDDKEFIKKTEEIILAYQYLKIPIRIFYTCRYKQNRGWSVETYPYNVGIKNARGDVIVLNSGDTMSATPTLFQHAGIQEAEKNVAAVSTVYAISEKVNMNREDWKNNPMRLADSSVAKLSTGNKFKRPLHFLMSVKKEALIRIGGFDESFYGPMSHGDNDLASRLVKSGITFKWYDDVIALHQWHPKPAVTAAINPSYKNGESRFKENQKKIDFVVNVGREWGQYPREEEWDRNRFTRL
jgi:glycosyltransferase involved in cell wall biosynthesis